MFEGRLRALRQRSLHHCQQLGDFLRVAGGVGSNATAEAVDERAKAMQLSVVDNEESVVEVVGVGDDEALVLRCFPRSSFKVTICDLKQSSLVS